MTDIEYLREKQHILTTKPILVCYVLNAFVTIFFYFGGEVTINLMRCFTLEGVFFFLIMFDVYIIKSPVCLALYSQEVFKNFIRDSLTFM